MKNSQTFNITESIKLIKEKSREKFDASVEVHVRLGINYKKGDQQVRSSVILPHGTGQTVRVAAFADGDDLAAARQAGADLTGSDDLIESIKKTGKLDFDVAVATPAMMSKLALIAKILGPKGLMPSPKDDTVTQDIGKTVKELKAGKLSFKNDDTGNLHVIIGKKSFDDTKLKENFEAFIETVKKIKPAGLKGEYIKGVYIKSSMSQSVKVNL